MDKIFGIFNDFDLYRDNDSLGLHTHYQYRYKLSFERIDYPIYYTRGLQRYWYSTVGIGAIYYSLLKLIQWLMRNRKPFDLRKVLFCWNMLLSISIVIALIRFAEHLFKFLLPIPIYSNNIGMDFADSLFNRGIYVSLCYSLDPYGVAAFYASFYGILKIVELGDTFFIVLRKRPLTFLHWFHHASALVYVFHCGAEHTGSGRIFMLMNLFVHSLLYPYFAVRALGYQTPRITSIALTTIQIVQLFLGILVIGYVIHVKIEATLPCQQSWGNILLGTIQYCIMLLLFIKYFINRYYRNSTKAKKVQ